MFRGDEDLLIGARRGSPLAVGYGDGEIYLGSDAFALAPFTNRVTYLEEGDWVVVRAATASTIFDVDGPAGRTARSRHHARSARRWSTRATIATSWRRKSSSSPKSSATRCTRYLEPRSAGAIALPKMPLRLRRRSRRHHHRRLRHRLLRRHGRRNTGSSSSRACRSKSMSPPNSAIAIRCYPKGGLALFVSQSRRDGRHAGGAAPLQGARARPSPPSSTCRKLDGARSRCRLPDPCRAGNRRRLDQGLHLPARGAGRARPSRPARARGTSMTREREAPRARCCWKRRAT